MDRVHGKQDGCGEGQVRLFEHTPFTRVHQHAGYSTVQTHIDHVEVQWCHAAQKDIQPDGDRETELYSQMSF